MKCSLVNVFSNEKLSGNGLTIFSECGNLSVAEMFAWTQEMRQFESIFLQRVNNQFHARIFTVEEELDFAGHPLLGLAYYLHETYGSEPAHEWIVHTNTKAVTLTSTRSTDGFTAAMNQGKPEFLYALSSRESLPLYTALNLTPPEQEALRSEVITTGLPYVILPVTSHLEAITFNVKDLEPLIAPFGAKFLYVLDVLTLEGRTWDNQGNMEDIATGSAAGPAAAYLFKHGLIEDTVLTLHQGRFLNRPSEILIHLDLVGQDIENIRVSGNVVKVAEITFVD
ncbi:PhzF family phenazine biosynthesis protein [Pseudomaricurvus sp. HS19]|uniref:PhzF family phenazine biosynthesis protein n=1 Tax=Pseudomaricurvus sp. HS19 TaxID=2692626 RepID=UPI00136C513A|nr:PhzF family phenazine biosynthesis protein [Pseudomaricurvus sp. HS19]MYM63688.1 PhzF family phenazine biosynthesis isomerase [Pseudomaricurvus sp. HS19]